MQILSHPTLCKSESPIDVIDKSSHNIVGHNLIDSEDIINLTALRPSKTRSNEPIEPSVMFQKSFSKISTKNIVLLYWNGGG